MDDEVTHASRKAPQLCNRVSRPRQEKAPVEATGACVGRQADAPRVPKRRRVHQSCPLAGQPSGSTLALLQRDAPT